MVEQCTIGRELNARGLACGREEGSTAKSVKVRGSEVGLALPPLLILFPALRHQESKKGAKRL